MTNGGLAYEQICTPGYNQQRAVDIRTVRMMPQLQLQTRSELCSQPS